MNDTKLVRFLLARIDEDETQLRRLARLTSRGSRMLATTGTYTVPRLQAECDARRHLIGHLQKLLVLRDLPCEKAVRGLAAQMLQSMASPHAEQDGYCAD